MLYRFENIPDEYKNINRESLITKINQAKKKIGKDLMILGHHYQTDDIIQFTDKSGDSLELAKIASKIDSKYIVFCGVHFMAETADILTKDEQIVILPDIEAGCYLADTADIEQVEDAWNTIKDITDDKIIPITYVNSTADLKAFCGKNDGLVCTSSNAQEIINWALKRADRIFFFPDQHLGRNTCYSMGYQLDQMLLWDDKRKEDKNYRSMIEKSKILLWNGFCDVHQKFNIGHINSIKKEFPDIKIIVHPECNFEVTTNSDQFGSTGKIINILENSKKGDKWAVGTEYNLVNRLKDKLKDKIEIHHLTKIIHNCESMGKIRLENLAFILENIIENRYINRIKVDDKIAIDAKRALDRMLKV